MKKILFTLLIGAFVASHSSAQIVYDAAGIPDSLKKGANAVKRFEDISFEVSDIDKAYYTVHQVYTVLNKRGEDNLIFNEESSKDRYLDEVEIKVYNALGIQISKYKKKDLIKYSHDEGLIEDGMNYYLKIPVIDYPVTVDCNYTYKFNGTLSYPTYAIITPEEGIQQSVFTAKVPVSLGLRYKEQKVKLAPEIANDGKYITYKWSVNNLTPIKNEEGGPASQFCYPTILLAPNSFKYYNTTGEMTSWKTFGQWVGSLINGLDVLPEDRKAFFINLTKDATTEREKVRLIYSYLQKNFRYVSIQLGIGGVKPFPAKFTDEKKYGDCKGLSFYVYSVLKCLGIRSHIALVNAYYNREPVDPGFPIDRFDHVILCVPQKNDSIWLDCTSKTGDFGVLGSFTESRNALLITENGGVLVPTPRSNASENTFTAVTDITLNEDGTGTTDTRICSKGEYREKINSVFKEKKDDQKQFIVNYLGFIQPDEFILSDKSSESGANTEIQLEIEKVPQFSAGDKMFLRPRIYSFCRGILPSSSNRTQDFYFEQPFEKADTTIYHIPANFTVDALPNPIDIKSAYSAYSTNYAYNKEKNEVITTTKLMLYKNRIPASNYAEVKNFFDQVIGDESQKMVIKKD